MFNSSMGPAIDFGQRLEVKMDKVDDSFAQELEDELMKFTSYEDSRAEAHLVKQNEEDQRKVDVEVNIMERTKSGGQIVIEAERGETTECSSSFSGSGSEVENGMGESEVLSKFYADAEAALGINGVRGFLGSRKKKPTTHWRLYIQPLMWRCKWAELQIKKFEAQAKKYERQLKEYTQQKDVQLGNCTSENVGVKSLPFPSKATESRVYRRKKRRRIETTTDVAAYMSNHNLLSYHANRKCSTESASMHDEFRNSVIATQGADTENDYWVKDESLPLENEGVDHPFERMLQKIEFLQSKVAKLKSRTNEVMSEHAGLFSCSDDASLSMTCNGLTGSPQDSDFPCCEGAMLGTYIASQLISEYNKGDVRAAESAVTSHGEGVLDENGNNDFSWFTDAMANIEEEDVLIDNQWLKEEMNNFELVIQPTPSPSVMKEGRESQAPVLAKTDMVREDQLPANVRSIPKLTPSQSKNKRRKVAGRQG